MKKFRAFKVEFVRPTDTKPARIRITDLRYCKKVIIGYTAKSASNQHERAIEYLKESGIEVEATAWAETKNQFDYELLLTSDFTTQLN